MTYYDETDEFNGESWVECAIDPYVGSLIIEIRRLQEARIRERSEAFTEGTLAVGDRVREDLFPVFRELVEWADNWLPDEAKDQGARDVLRRCKEILNSG